jgi:hypothetical protein
MRKCKKLFLTLANANEHTFGTIQLCCELTTKYSIKFVFWNILTLLLLKNNDLIPRNTFSFSKYIAEKMRKCKKLFLTLANVNEHTFGKIKLYCELTMNYSITYVFWNIVTLFLLKNNDLIPRNTFSFSKYIVKKMRKYRKLFSTLASANEHTYEKIQFCYDFNSNMVKDYLLNLEPQHIWRGKHLKSLSL